MHRATEIKTNQVQEESKCPLCWLLPAELQYDIDLSAVEKKASWDKGCYWRSLDGCLRGEK